MNIWFERGILVLGGMAAGAIVTHLHERRRFVDLEIKTSESLEKLYAEAKKKEVTIEAPDFSQEERRAIVKRLDEVYGEKNPYEMIVEDIEKTLDMSIPGDEDEVDEADIPF